MDNFVYLETKVRTLEEHVLSMAQQLADVHRMVEKLESEMGRSSEHEERG